MSAVYSDEEITYMKENGIMLYLLYEEGTRNREKVLEEFKKEGIDSWLVYSYGRGNPNFVALTGCGKFTVLNQSFLILHPDKRPVLVTYKLNEGQLDYLSKLVDIKCWGPWHNKKELLANAIGKPKKIAMECSPENPGLDVLTVNLNKLLNEIIEDLEIMHSGVLLQYTDGILSPKQEEQMRIACKDIMQIAIKAFRFINEEITKNKKVEEFAVQQFIMEQYEKHKMTCEKDFPIVAIGKNAIDPHYKPSDKKSSPIVPGEIVMIDLWAKKDDPNGIYADTTWVGYVGKEVPDEGNSKSVEYIKAFEYLVKARDSVFRFMKTKFKSGDPIQGYECCDIARTTIPKKYPTYGHNTGHGIGRNVHHIGAGFYNYSFKEIREIIPGTFSSDEPGIYIPNEFGMRSEIDIFFGENGPEIVTKPYQTAIIPILAPPNEWAKRITSTDPE